MGAPIYGYTQRAQKALEKDSMAMQDAIKVAATKNHLDYKDFCKVLGCTPKTWNRRKANPELLTLGELRKLSTVIDIPSDALLTLAGVTN